MKIKMEKIPAIFFEAAVILLIVAAALEITLRLFPGLIPPKVLILFQKEARREIASRLRLQTIDDSVILDPDDGGPTIYLPKPFAAIRKGLVEEDAMKTMVMDEKGFCNPERAYDRPAIDIIAVGDSFTWCFGVAAGDTWTVKLASLSGLAAYNLGVGGTGPPEYLQLLKKFGLPKSPKLVIMNISAGNDLLNAAAYEAKRQRLLTGRYETVLGLAPPPCDLPPALCSAYRFVRDGFIGRRSYSFNLIVHGLRVSRDEFKQYARRFASAEDSAPADHRYDLAFPDGAVVPFNIENTDVAVQSCAECLKTGAISFDLFDKPLEELAALARRHGFSAAAAYTPMDYMVYRGVIRFEDPDSAAEGELLSWFSAVQRDFLEAKTKALGIAFIDLTPPLRKAAAAGGEKALLYFPGNLHYTREGHKAVAAALYGALLEKGLLPPENGR